MKQFEIDNLKVLIDVLDSLSSLNYNLTLFRGQSLQYPLLPSIARKNNKIDTTDIERQMLNEFRRRNADPYLNQYHKDDWELIFFGQHFGLKTRLLDWSTNPLISLWFALWGNENDSYLYVMSLKKTDIYNDFKENPYDLNSIKVVKPTLNNKRIISQSGWFSIHNYNKAKNQFVPLNEDKQFENRIFELKIPKKCSSMFLNQLGLFGINSEFIYQDISGTCQHINFLNNI